MTRHTTFQIHSQALETMPSHNTMVIRKDSFARRRRRHFRSLDVRKYHPWKTPGYDIYAKHEKRTEQGKGNQGTNSKGKRVFLGQNVRREHVRASHFPNMQFTGLETTKTEIWERFTKFCASILMDAIHWRQGQVTAKMQEESKYRDTDKEAVSVWPPDEIT